MKLLLILALGLLDSKPAPTPMEKAKEKTHMRQQFEQDKQDPRRVTVFI